MLSRTKRIIIQIIFGGAIIGLALFMDSLELSDAAISQFVMHYGYVGILLVSIVSGFNLLVPIPVIAFLPFFVSLGLHPTWTILLIAFGMTVGDVLGYLIGNGGRRILDVDSARIVKKLEHLKQKNRFLPALSMFLYAAFVPAPNEIIMIPLGFMRVRWWLTISAAFVGNIVFNLLAGHGLLATFG